MRTSLIMFLQGMKIHQTGTQRWSQVTEMSKYIKILKKHIKQPVTFCEGAYFWNTSALPLVEDVDFISIHIYPFWQRKKIEEALALHH